MRYNRWLGLLCTVLSLSVILTCFPSISRAEEPDVSYYSVIEDLQFEVDVKIVTSWDIHANLEFAVHNKGTETIHNWYLTFDLPYQIEGIWNAEGFEADGTGVYTIKNNVWNQDILPGSTVNFGMTVASLNGQTVESLPPFYLLNTCEKDVDPSCYTLTYQEYSNWGQGYNGGLILSNVSSETIEDWRLSFKSNRFLAEVSGGTLTNSGDAITISNDGDNQNLSTYASWNMTVNGNEQSTDEPFETDDITITSICCAYRLSEDKDMNGIADYLDFINTEIEKRQQGEETEITDIPTPTETPVPTEEPIPTVTEEPGITVVPSDTPTSEPTVVPTPDVTPTPDPVLDSDGDGIPDYYEEQLGTDPYSEYSDDDQLDDALEILLGFDPLSSDTDGDGISDDQEDNDGDGMTILQELELGTYLWTDDSDIDGLKDGDEVIIYGTDPLSPDTDGDGIADGDELKLGIDPMSTDSDDDGIPDNQERFLQTREEAINNEERPVVTKVEITLEGTGCLDTDMSIKDIYGVDTYSSDLVGLVGVPVEIEYEGEFEEATITFHYDPEMLKNTHPVGCEDLPGTEDYVTNERSLAIFYFDEESGMYVDCDATVDTVNHTVSCTTTHFSTYLLTDEFIWLLKWRAAAFSGEVHPSHEGYTGIDYVMEIPCVTSMTEDDIAEMNEIACQIIDNMQPNDRMVIRGYNYLGSYVYTYTNDKELLKRQVTEWPWDGETNWVGYTNYKPYDLLKTSLSSSEIFNIGISSNGHIESNELVAIAFNNSTEISAEPFIVPSHREKQDITAYIFTLSSGNPNSIQMKWLNRVAGGGVIDCEGKSADEVYKEFSKLYSMRQGEDNEIGKNGQPVGDGLWDIYELQGMIASNGRYYYSSPSRIDSDRDGLTDAQEMGSLTVIEVTHDSKLYVDGELYVEGSPFGDAMKWSRYLEYLECGAGRWYVYRVKSNPEKEDSDRDDCPDIEDARPLDKNKSISYILYDANSDWFLEYEAVVRREKDYTDDEIEMIPVTGKQGNTLSEEWNKLGESAQGKTLYNIKEVVLVFHGSEGTISGISTSDISSWKKKDIATLILSSCHSGELSQENNPARTFMNMGTIGEVYAWNGSATYLGISRPVLLIPDNEQSSFRVFSLPIAFSAEMSFDWYPEYVTAVASDFVYCIDCIKNGDFLGLIGLIPRVEHQIDDISKIGRYRYYRNSDGEVEYEKVSWYENIDFVFLYTD